MCFSVLTLPAIAAMASANPIAAPAEGGLFARDEYRWCLGERLRRYTISVPMTDNLDRREDQQWFPKEIQIPHAQRRYQQDLQWRPFRRH